jgi:hypothetical protein
MNCSTFAPKIFIKMSKVYVWDPESGIRKKSIPDPGSGGKKCTGSRIRIRNTGKNRIKTYNAVIILSLQDTFLPLLMAKLKMYGLYDNFAEMAHGFCDFTSFMTAMHMGQICRATKFGDMVDVYKQVTGRPWPKDVTHRYSP